MCLKNAGRNFIKIFDGKNPLKSDLILEKKYAPALDNYGQSCFARSDFFKNEVCL
jgi:hypothetical protein